MPGRWKAAHITADLRKDHSGCQDTNAWDRYQKRDQDSEAGPTRLDFLIHSNDRSIDLPIDLSDRCVEGIDLSKMKLEQEAMVLCDPTAQGLAELLPRSFDPPVCQARQLVRVSLTRNHRLEHRTAAHADDLSEDGVKFDVGVFKRLLHPLDMAGLFPAQLLASA